MIMDDFEIERDYRHAKNKVEQIHILADMNMCSKKEIEELLEKRGVTVLKCSTLEERSETIRRLYYQGMYDEDIAIVTGLKPSSVGQIRQRLGLKKHKKRRKPAKEQTSFEFN